MALLVIAVVLVLVLGAAIWITSTLVGLLLTLVMAALVGMGADAVVPGKLPYGLVGAALAGIIGGFIGHLILDDIGPSLFGVRIIPAFVGAVVVAAVAELVTHSRSRRALS